MKSLGDEEKKEEAKEEAKEEKKEEGKDAKKEEGKGEEGKKPDDGKAKPKCEWIPPALEKEEKKAAMDALPPGKKEEA